MPAYMKNSYYKMEMYSGWEHPDKIPSKAAIRKKQKSDRYRNNGEGAFGGYDMIFYPIDGGFYPDEDVWGGDGGDFGGSGGDDGGGGFGGCGGGGYSGGGCGGGSCF